MFALPWDPADKDHIRKALDEGRARTWDLVGRIDDDALAQPAAEYLSPPVWDLGHIGNFEELWLVQNLLGEAEMRQGYNDIYDAFAHPRAERPKLALLDRDGCRTYQNTVRDRAMEVLEAVDLDLSRLTKDGFVYWMIVLHEHQHQETLLQTMQMLGPDRVDTRDAPALPSPQKPLARPDRIEDDAYVAIPSGPTWLGREHRPGAYDNEASPHVVDVPAFRMARYPVTCGQYLRFMEAGGYEDLSLWSERGKAWLAETDHHAPLYWHIQDGTWHRQDLLGSRPVDKVADEILCHVTYFEAEAFARWAGARLPTEAEWEKACRGPEGTLNPWGDAPTDPGLANIDHSWRLSRAGAYPQGVSAYGIEHMIGDVWEWCQSGFEAYPDFDAFPYDAYSKVFFGGDYQILRGGAWAARAGCSHGTFRNWDHPYRRQIFSGIRLVRD